MVNHAPRQFTAFCHLRSLSIPGRLPEVQEVVQEYLDQKHAEEVPLEDLKKPQDQVFYVPMHAVCKESSTTTKIRDVFDALLPHPLVFLSTPPSWSA